MFETCSISSLNAYDDAFFFGRGFYPLDVSSFQECLLIT
jgi:hypothetical protein